MCDSIKLAVKQEADLDQVRAHPQDIEAKCREMRRHQPARFVAVGNDHRLDSERSPQLILEFGPELGQPALGDHAAKIGVRRSENAVVAVELAIGEPKAVVGAGIEPAAVIFLGSIAQNRGGRTDIVAMRSMKTRRFSPRAANTASHFSRRALKALRSPTAAR